MSEPAHKVNLLPLEAAAAALEIGASTLSLYVTRDAPVAVRGRRGRGGAALFDVEAVRAWIARRKAPASIDAGAPRTVIAGGTKRETLLSLYADLQADILDALLRTYETLPPAIRLTAGDALASAGLRALWGMRDRFEWDADDLPDLEPKIICRLESLRPRR